MSYFDQNSQQNSEAIHRGSDDLTKYLIQHQSRKKSELDNIQKLLMSSIEASENRNSAVTTGSAIIGGGHAKYSPK